jgi:hypothetical protein
MSCIEKENGFIYPVCSIFRSEENKVFTFYSLSGLSFHSSMTGLSLVC